MASDHEPRRLTYDYDEGRDVLTIEGVPYSGSVFRAWSANGLPIGKRFEIVKREETGIIWLRELREEEESDLLKDSQHQEQSLNPPSDPNVADSLLVLIERLILAIDENRNGVRDRLRAALGL